MHTQQQRHLSKNMVSDGRSLSLSNVETQKPLLRLTGIVSVFVAVVLVAADELLQYLPQ